jgi:SAM-dependent methyltransferase
MRKTTLSAAVKIALAASTIKDNILTLPGSLDRKTYQDVDKVLKEVGGKWSKGKKGHVFASDPTDQIQNIVDSGEVLLLSKNGYFPTPRALAEQTVNYADIWDDMTVLEPSAGSGGLADVIRELHPEAKLTLVEIQPKLCLELRAKGYEPIQADFLAMTPEPIFDRVVMNPPFEHQGDIDHIAHALKFLKPGGRLSAIGGGSWLYRQDKKTKAFHELLNDYAMMDDQNPEGSFKDSGTMVGTRTVVLWKPKE